MIEIEEKVGEELLPPHAQQELFEESLHVVAAKQRLVVVTKFLPAWGMTEQEEAIVKLLEQKTPAREQQDARWGMIGNGSWPRAEERVQENVGMLFPLPSDKRFPRGSAYVVNFVPVGALTRDEMFYARDCLRKAEEGPAHHTIRASAKVESLAGVREEK